MTIDRNIHALRELKNYTQEYMAEQLQMSQANYSKLENGTIDVSIKKLQVIAQVLDINLFEILSFPRQTLPKGTPDTIQKLYEEQIQQLKSENEYLRGVIEKLLEKK